jgi:hypothetical protein
MELFSFRVGCFLVGDGRLVFQRGVKAAATVVRLTTDNGKSKTDAIRFLDMNVGIDAES